MGSTSGSSSRRKKYNATVVAAVIAGVFAITAACITGIATIIAGGWVLFAPSSGVPFLPQQPTYAQPSQGGIPVVAPPPTEARGVAPEPTSTPGVEIRPTVTPLPPRPTEPPPAVASFSDDFGSGPSSAWQPLSGSWRVVDGAYTADSPTERVVYSMVGELGWRDYAIDVDVTVACQGGYPIALVLRSLDPGNGMQMHIDCCAIRWVLYRSGSAQTIAELDEGIPICCGGTCWETSHIRVEVQGNLYTMYLNGVRMLQVQDNTYQYGRAGVGVECPWDCPRFDNFRVSSLE